MARINIVTGHTGTPHVSSNDVRHFNAALIGDGDYILAGGNQFAVTMSGANSVSVASGEACVQGTHVRSESAVVVDLEVGTSGYKRYDLVGIMVNVNGSGEETAEIIGIKGTPTTGTPASPSYTHQNILSGGTVRFMPLARVEFNGTSISKITKLATVQLPMSNPVVETKTYEVTPTGGGRAQVNTGGKVIAMITTEQANVVGVPYSKSSSSSWVQFMVTNSANNAMVPYTSPVSGTMYLI